MPAAVATGPAATLIDMMSEVEYASVHWRPAGGVPVVEANDKARDVLPPCVAVLEDSDNVSDCPKAFDPKHQKQINRTVTLLCCPITYLSYTSRPADLLPKSKRIVVVLLGLKQRYN